MPKYSFKNTTTGELFELDMKYSDLEPYLQNNPYHKQVFTHFPGVVSGSGSLISKTPDGFKDILRNIKKNHPGGNIDV